MQFPTKALLGLNLWLCLCATEARAGFIVNQPLSANPAGQDGFYSDGLDSGSGGRQRIAGDFNLASPALVTDIQWWGAYRDGSTPSGSFQFLVEFYSDSGGVPGTLIIREVLKVTGVPTGLTNSGGLPILAYESTLGSPGFNTVSLNAGGRYWISIQEDDARTAFANEWTWQFSDVGDRLFASESSSGFAWGVGQDKNTAFILSDDSVPTVPEPSSLALLGSSGVITLVGYVWRRRIQTPI
jgi:hypothetical protein